jgi:hypothetical protein
MGQFSVEKPVAPGSVLSGNQHSLPPWIAECRSPVRCTPFKARRAARARSERGGDQGGIARTQERPQEVKTVAKAAASRVGRDWLAVRIAGSVRASRPVGAQCRISMCSNLQPWPRSVCLESGLRRGQPKLKARFLELSIITMVTQSIFRLMANFPMTRHYISSRHVLSPRLSVWTCIQ